ncbi:CysB family HTH-type transcriptional regulator [Methylophaga sulfidovorans]|uniref:LysR family transcriptional regulator, cys regulon transcriptional activator n=1 Tax=Methylophaga sulfidovorans TaxID=45496 RepID=A0A1I3UCT8_9GAMM|nr:CysB family HTH-type transcriptional regulator [Methylophaga sulfidovorans]SFJ79686.1 LysR family transcriptional regulator, cys regulon transcriptional activator [Methylophaga sulfidovorans]
MHLHQLRYIREIVRNDLSISKAAKVLKTSQPSVSNQLQQLEEELRLKVFERRGKRLVAITPMGKNILEIAERVLRDVQNIESLADESHDEEHGTLSIGTTQTQALYALPNSIKAFSERYPNIHLNMLQGSPKEIAELAAVGEIDLAIATETLDQNPDLITFPCYDWNRTIVVPDNHPLLSEKILTLEAVAKYPILTYMMEFTGRAQQDQSFKNRGLKPNVIFTATDADVIKKYVGIGLGIGIIASMAFDTKKDRPLKEIDASHLFQPSTTLLAFRRGCYLRGYTYAFIECFAPHLTKEVIEQRLT